MEEVVILKISVGSGKLKNITFDPFDQNRNQKLHGRVGLLIQEF